MPEARKRATRCSFRTPGRHRPCGRMRRCHIAQFARRISTCAKCRVPRNEVATRSSRAPILARAGTHGAAQAPLAGFRLEAPATADGTALMKDLVWRRIRERGVRTEVVVPALETRQ